MKLRSFLASGALVLSLAAIGSAKSWDIVVSSATKAGSTVLPAGNYNVKLNNNQIMFKDSNSGKTYTAPAKVQNADHKYSDTAVMTKKQGNTDVIESIDLGGTTEKVEFGE